MLLVDGDTAFPHTVNNVASLDKQFARNLGDEPCCAVGILKRLMPWTRVPPSTPVAQMPVVILADNFEEKLEMDEILRAGVLPCCHRFSFHLLLLPPSLPLPHSAPPPPPSALPLHPALSIYTRSTLKAG